MSRRRRFGRAIGTAVAAALAASVAALIPAAPAGAAPPVDPPFSAHGITVVDWDPYDARPRDPDNALMYDARVTTDAVFTPASAPDVTLGIRIYLPKDYDHNRPNGYPVLYLLHGGTHEYRDWAERGNVLTAIEASGYKGIVVMPEGGRSGWYHDWVGNTVGGFRPLWETFHVDQLVPWVDDNFNTDAQASSRAIAGLSMGGSGALKYAGRHPSVFGKVAAFSGGPDMNATHDGDPNTGTAFDADAAEIIYAGLSTAGARIEDQGNNNEDFDVLPDGTPEEVLTHVFGPRSGWAAANPQDMAENGAYAPFDGDMALYTGQDRNDYEVSRWNTAFHDTLVAQGVDHRFCLLRGSHTWRYWHQHVTHYLTTLAGNPAPACPTTTWP